MKINSNVCNSKIFKNELNFYSKNVYPKIYQKYKLIPAKGGKRFEEIFKQRHKNDLSDMSYPFHILNGIIPAIKLLENKWLNCGYIGKETEDRDFSMLIKCFLMAFTFHDIDKVFTSVKNEGLKENLEYLNKELMEIGTYREEEIDIIKYLIMATEERTRHTIPDHKLPSRRGLHRLIKEDLTEYVHFADSISSVNAETSSDLYKLWAKIKEHVPDINILIINDSPYEVLSRFIVEQIRKKQKSNIFCYAVNSKCIIYEGNLKLDESVIVQYLKELFYNNLDKIIVMDRQKAQLDIFRYIEPNFDEINKLIDYLNNDLFFTGISTDEKYKIKFSRIIEEFTETETRKFKLLKFIYQLTLNDGQKTAEKLKKELKNKYSSKNYGLIGFTETEAEEILVKPDAGLKNYLNLCVASKENFSENELIESIVELLKLNYGGKESINIENVAKEFLQYIAINGELLREIEPILKFYSKSDTCCICGKETNIVALDNLCFGFKPRGFTNRTIVTTENIEKKICCTCATEVATRKIIFGKKEGGFTVYVNPYAYLVPVQHSEELKNFIELNLKQLKPLLQDFEDYTKTVVYGEKVSENYLPSYLMGFINLRDKIDYIKFYRDILELIKNTGLKVHVTYPYNPEMFCKETLVFTNAPKFIKKLSWDKLRLDEVEKTSNLFNTLYTLGLMLKGSSKSYNDVVSIFEDFSDSPLSFYYYLSKLENPINYAKKHEQDIEKISKIVGESKMSVIQKMADIASDISWSGRSGSSKTKIFRKSFDVLKTGVKQGLDAEEIKELIAGVIYNDNPYPSKKENVMEFSRVFHDNLYADIWKKTIPSKKELKYWIYGFAYQYDVYSQKKKSEK